LLVLYSSPVSFPHPSPSPFRPFATSQPIYGTLYGLITIDDQELQNSNACRIYHLEWPLYTPTNP
jgi:hypothetical protein